MAKPDREWPSRLRPSDPQDRRLAGGIALLIVALVGLRAILGRYPLWFDELASLVLADQPLARLWGPWMVKETNPPLFYTLLKGWVFLGFGSVPALRLLPELGAAAELALLALAARIGWGRKAAVAAVLLAGFSAQHVYAGQLLRGYIFAADGVLLALTGLLLVLREPSQPRRGLLLYVLGSVIAIHCHTTLLTWPPAAMAGMVWARPALFRAGDRALLTALLMANLAILLASAWWLAITLTQVRAGSSNIRWIQSLPLDQYGDLLLRTVMLVNQLYKVERIGVLIVCAALVGAAWLTRRQPAARLVLGAASCGAAGLGLISLVHPIATLMTPFWLSPLVVLAIAGGIEALPGERSAGAARLALLAVLIVNLFAHGSQLTVQDFAGAIRTAAAQPGAALLVEHRTLGAVTAKACQLEFPGRACPVPIVAVVMPGETQTWAAAVPGVSYAAPDQIAAVLRCCDSVFALRTLEHDPLLHFGIMPASSRIAWNEPFIEGPLPRQRFATARWQVDAHPYSTTNPAM